MSVVIALLGAESTGKTTLAEALRQTLEQSGRTTPDSAGFGQRVALVPEYLREFCLREGRTPRRDEQAHIAEEQSRRIEQAARDHDVVVADTTALMTAVYSEHVFGDTSLYAYAQAQQRLYQHTLLTATDLPWEADPMRDGAHVREPVTTLLRTSLLRAQLPYAVVSGAGAERLRCALAAIGHTPSEETAPGRRWQWVCDRCSDAECERHLLARDVPGSN